jgi:hypothetical protein
LEVEQVAFILAGVPEKGLDAFELCQAFLALKVYL